MPGDAVPENRSAGACATRIQAGDLLVASSAPGFAMSDPDPRTGTVVGKALASWSAGQGEIPAMVGLR